MLIWELPEDSGKACPVTRQQGGRARAWGLLLWRVSKTEVSLSSISKPHCHRGMWGWGGYHMMLKVLFYFLKVFIYLFLVLVATHRIFDLCCRM